nr:MAG TPA: hypothetical protein [Bacteriophage sp.]
MANSKYQNIQLLWTNTLDNPPNPQDLELGQPLINIRDGIETLYFRNEKGDGLLEFIEKQAVIDLVNEIIEQVDLGEINEKLANKVHAIVGENCIKCLEDRDSDGNKIVKVSVKMDTDSKNKAIINENGLFVSNITDCGAF